MACIVNFRGFKANEGNLNQFVSVFINFIDFHPVYTFHTRLIQWVIMAGQTGLQLLFLAPDKLSFPGQ